MTTQKIKNLGNKLLGFVFFGAFFAVMFVQWVHVDCTKPTGDWVMKEECRLGTFAFNGADKSNWKTNTNNFFDGPFVKGIPTPGEISPSGIVFRVPVNLKGSYENTVNPKRDVEIYAHFSPSFKEPSFPDPKHITFYGVEGKAFYGRLHYDDLASFYFSD